MIAAIIQALGGILAALCSGILGVVGGLLGAAVALQASQRKMRGAPEARPRLPPGQQLSGGILTLGLIATIVAIGVGVAVRNWTDPLTFVRVVATRPWWLFAGAAVMGIAGGVIAKFRGWL